MVTPRKNPGASGFRPTNSDDLRARLPDGGAASSTASDIGRWVAEHTEEIAGLAATFIARASENLPPTGNERLFQVALADELRTIGMDVSTFLVTDVEGIDEHPLYWPGRDYKDRPNVVGTLRGTGTGKSLMLAGHGDVVVGLAGDYKPFEPTIVDGRLFGRGASDMKGGLAAAVMAVRCLRDLAIPLAGDLLVESVVDEEMAGANGTLASRLLGNNPDAAVIMEPTGLRVCPGHLGGRVYRIRIHGAGGMAFGGMDVVSPLHAMARFLVACEEVGGRRHGLVAPGDQLGPPFNTIVSIARSGSYELGQGTGVPTEAVVEVWVESGVHTTADQLDASFLAFCERVVADDPLLAKCRVAYERVTRFIPGSSIANDHPIVQAALAALAAVIGPTHASVETAPFACDGFVFHAFGVPALILGPTGDNAHAADEYVLTESVADLTAVLANLAVAWCGEDQLPPLGEP